MTHGDEPTPSAPHRPGRLRLRVLAALTLALSACTAGALLGPDADQGIDGLVLSGPHCPVQPLDDPCPDRPYAARIDVREHGGGRVTTVRSGDDGRFHVGLRPGRYLLRPDSGDPFPFAQEQEVTVEAGVWSEVTVLYDTGIR